LVPWRPATEVGRVVDFVESLPSSVWLDHSAKFGRCGSKYTGIGGDKHLAALEPHRIGMWAWLILKIHPLPHELPCRM